MATPENEGSINQYPVEEIDYNEIERLEVIWSHCGFLIPTVNLYRRKKNYIAFLGRR